MAEEIRASIKVKDLATRGFKAAGRGVLRFSRTAVRNIRRVNRAIKRMEDSIFSVKRVLQGFVAFKTFEAAGRLLTEIADTGDRFAKLNQRLGISVKLLSGLAFAAERSGIEFNTLQMGIQRAVRRMEQFRQTGRGEAAAAFKILGGGIAEAVKQGKSFEELLPRIADRFQGLGSEQERVLAAMKLFDSEGVKLVQLLGLGSTEIERLSIRAQELGRVFSERAARDAEKFVDALTDLKSALIGVATQASVRLFGTLAEGIKNLTNFIVENRTVVIRFIVTVLQRFLQALGNILITIETLGNAIIRLANRFVKTKIALLDFRQTFKALNDTVGELEKVKPTELERALERLEIRFVRTKLAALDALGVIKKSIGDIPGFFSGREGEAEKKPKEDKPRGQQVPSIFGIKDPVEGLRAAFAVAKFESQNLGTVVASTVLQARDAIVGNLSEAIFDFASGVKDAQTAFKDFVRAIAADIGRLLIRQGLNLATNALLGVGAPTGAGAARGGIIPGLQAGGIVTSQRLLNTALGAVRVRERGQNEAVVPLPDNRSIPVRLQGSAQPQTTIVRQEFRFEVKTIDSAGVDKFLNDNKEKIRGLSAQGMRTDFIFNQQMRGATV